MTKEQRQDEEQARQDELQGRVSALIAQGAMNWVWPGSGEDGDGLPRNCFFTGLLQPRKPHANAPKCNFTPLPGNANKRHKKRQRAGMQRSGARVA